MPGPYGVVRVSHRTVDSLDADLAGENAGVAALIMDDQAAVGIDIGCNTGTAVIGHAAAQIDAEGLVTLPIGGKALGLSIPPIKLKQLS